MSKPATKAYDVKMVADDAELSAIYLRTLLANGVDIVSALSLTGTYVWATKTAATMKRDLPKEPWEGE